MSRPRLGRRRFESVAVYLEQTIEDEDSELTFEAITGTAGLATLKVVAPDGRTVVDYKAADSKLGIRHVTLESPEPKNDGNMKADFPTGVYKFTGTDTTGATLQGEATLSHKFPDTAHLVRPRPDEKNVPITGMQVKWNAVKDATAIILVIEHEKTGREVKANLPGSATRSRCPMAFWPPVLNTSSRSAPSRRTETGRSPKRHSRRLGKSSNSEGTDHEPDVPA